MTITSDGESGTTSTAGARVLQVALSLNPGGTERLILDLVIKLHAAMPMAVCCLDQPGAWASELTRRGITVTAIGRAHGFTPSTAGAIARAARAHNATVIHAHHYSPFVYSCLARFRRQTPVVFTEHGRLSDTGPSPKRRIANRILRALPSRVFTVSSELGDHLADEGFSRPRIGVIYNGIEPGPRENAAARSARRQELVAGPETFVIGTVARLDPVKDLGVLLRAGEDLARRRNILLVIIGDGPERASLERTAAGLGLGKSVRFLGRRDDARDWLWACDAYVNCSISEGVSLTILEAMAAGLPVIATRVGGTPEVVDETCGCLIPARDVAALTAALSSLADDTPRREGLGRAARARVESRFTIDRMVREYADVYRAVTRETGAGRVTAGRA
ncbi:MAG TPA: glycosyltransferase [Vicinamibacterales bacterium]|nr:glycosyltransferase [Vicinamibacterales bacterium]